MIKKGILKKKYDKVSFDINKQVQNIKSKGYSESLFLVIIFTWTFTLFKLILDMHVVIKLNVGVVFAAQTSISLVGVAILSLLTNSIRDVFLGTNISRFLIDEEPYFFKSKRIITIQFLLLIISMILLIFELEVFVVICLNIAIMLALIHSWIVMGIFKESESIEDRILKKHLSNVIKKDTIYLRETLKRIQIGRAHV